MMICTNDNGNKKAWILEREMRNNGRNIFSSQFIPEYVYSYFPNYKCKTL